MPHTTRSTYSLMLVTYRDDEIGASQPLRAVIGDLATAPLTHRMTLPPTAVGAVVTLTADSDVDPVAVHRQTDGNPFFVTDVLAAGATEIAASVHDAVLTRADRLSHEARSALDAAAILGPPIDGGVVLRIAGSSIEALDECVVRGVLRVTGESLEFRHELGRQAILSAIGPARRRALHARTLAVLRAGPTESRGPWLTHHAAGAGDRDGVLVYPPTARRASELEAHREAVAQYEQALRFADHLPAEERADLLGTRRVRRSMGDDRRNRRSLRTPVAPAPSPAYFRSRPADHCLRHSPPRPGSGILRPQHQAPPSAPGRWDAWC